jgi:hypothetical protein
MGISAEKDNMYHRRFSVLALFVALAACGCGGGPAGPKKVPVGGTVSLDGKPIPTGFIYFKTVSSGDIDAFDIKDGKFSGQTIAGPRRVEVSVITAKTTEINGMKNETKVDTIPEKYNTKSELTATVEPGGSKSLAFDLKSE